jgi:hypothetical protein
MDSSGSLVASASICLHAISDFLLPLLELLNQILDGAQILAINFLLLFLQRPWRAVQPDTFKWSAAIRCKSSRPTDTITDIFVPQPLAFSAPYYILRRTFGPFQIEKMLAIDSWHGRLPNRMAHLKPIYLSAGCNHENNIWIRTRSPPPALGSASNQNQIHQQFSDVWDEIL